MGARKSDPTIYDVARAAAVSPATVSRVINHPSRVKEVTRRRVLDVVSDLGFVPRAEAIARARKHFGRIGVITPFFTAPSFVQRMRGIANAMASSRYELIVYTVQSAAQLEEYIVTLPISHRVDGLIIMSLPLEQEVAARLSESGLPVVCIEYHNPLFSSVVIDDHEGGAMAVRYLVERGYRRLAFLGESGEPDYALNTAAGRLEGFRRTVAELGLEMPEERVRLRPYTMKGALQEAESLLALPQRPDAVFASSDLQAIAVLRAARRLGIRVPDELGVIGFDNIDAAEYLALTTVNQSLDESGRISLELLLSRIEDPSRPIQNVRLPLSIVERESSLSEKGGDV